MASQYILLGMPSDFPFSMKEIYNGSSPLILARSISAIILKWSGEVWLVVLFDFDTNTMLDSVKYYDAFVGRKLFINKDLCCFEFWLPVTAMWNRLWELLWLKSLNSVVRVSSEITRFVGTLCLGALNFNSHFTFLYHYISLLANCIFSSLSIGYVSIFPFIYKTEQYPPLSIENVQLTPNFLFSC